MLTVGDSDADMRNLVTHRVLQRMYSAWERVVHHMCSTAVTGLFEEFLDQPCLLEPWR